MLQIQVAHLTNQRAPVLYASYQFTLFLVLMGMFYSNSSRYNNWICENLLVQKWKIQDNFPCTKV